MSRVYWKKDGKNKMINWLTYHMIIQFEKSQKFFLNNPRYVKESIERYGRFGISLDTNDLFNYGINEFVSSNIEWITQEEIDSIVFKALQSSYSIENRKEIKNQEFINWNIAEQTKYKK